MDGRRRGQLANLPRRIYLTYKYWGISSLIYRAMTFPPRFTPLQPHLRLDLKSRGKSAAAVGWHHTAATDVRSQS